MTPLEWFFNEIKDKIKDGDDFESIAFTFAIARQKEREQLRIDGVSGSLPSDDEIKLTGNGFGSLENAINKAKGNVR